MGGQRMTYEELIENQRNDNKVRVNSDEHFWNSITQDIYDIIYCVSYDEEVRNNDKLKFTMSKCFPYSYYEKEGVKIAFACNGIFVGDDIKYKC